MPLPTSPPPLPTADDPHALGPAVRRLPGSARKAARAALAIASAVLDDDEVVECLVAGQVEDVDGVAILTNRRLVLLNGREWRPDRIDIALDPDVTVRGEAAGAEASLTIGHAGATTVIGRIGEVPLAQELAQRIRARVSR